MHRKEPCGVLAFNCFLLQIPHWIFSEGQEGQTLPWPVPAAQRHWGWRMAAFSCQKCCMHAPSFFFPAYALKHVTSPPSLHFFKMKQKYIFKRMISFFSYCAALLRTVEQLPECSVWCACTMSACLGISSVHSLLSCLEVCIYHFFTQAAPSKVTVTPRPWSPSKIVTSSGRCNGKTGYKWCSVFKMTVQVLQFGWRIIALNCAIFWGHVFFLFPWPMKTLTFKDWHYVFILLWHGVRDQFDGQLGVI